MNEQPSYYAVLTADVRYNKNISANAKLLYAELTALSQKEGYAWASNQYFAELYGVHKDTVSSWVSELVKEKFIKISVDRKSGNLRKIILNNTIGEKTEGIGKNAYTYRRKDRYPIGENADIILQDNIKNNRAIKRKDYRGMESDAKNKIKEALTTKNFRVLKNT